MNNNWPYTNVVDPKIYDIFTYWPKISIVTPSYNQGNFIEETILSIINQNYPNLEYIIIDGGSTDNTIDIIKKYEDRITYWVSELDNGQAHAINKGFEKATGNIFAYLNSDDCYYVNTLFEIALAYTRNIEDRLLFIGNCCWAQSFDDQQSWLDIPKFPTSLSEALKQRGLASQPSMFWTNPLKLKFNEELKFCLDFEFWLKLIINNYHVIYIHKTISLFRLHPHSKTSTLSTILNGELNGLINIYKKHLTLSQQIEITSINIKNIEKEYRNLSILTMPNNYNFLNKVFYLIKNNLLLSFIKSKIRAK